MTRSRKVLLVLIILVLLADYLPVTHQEMSWWWVQSRNHSADYGNYLSDWPKGRHVAEARILFVERQRAELTRAQIRQAYQAASQAKSVSDETSRHELLLRRDNFFWKQATSANTVQSYNDYLREFPQGTFSTQAHQRLQALGTPAPENNK